MRTDSSWTDRGQEVWNLSDSTPSSLSMLTRCFDRIFTDLYLQVSSDYNRQVCVHLFLFFFCDIPKKLMSYYLNRMQESIWNLYFSYG